MTPHPPTRQQPRQLPKQRRGQRLRGLAATVLLLLLVVCFPLALVAVGAAPWELDRGSIDELRTLLTSPDDGTLALAVFAVVGWIAWAVMAASILVAAAAQLRGMPAPSIPGLALPQRAAGQLVTVAALLFVTAPTVAAAFPAPPTARAAPMPVHQPHRDTTAAVAPAISTPTQVSAATTDEPDKQHREATVDYTVRRGDSLWKLAERWLGDAHRYQELEQLNRDVLGEDPDFLPVGLVLQLPVLEAPPAAQEADVVVVEPGETLSEIAQDELGDADAYMRIFDASTHTLQPDGRHLTDPNLIRPGWALTIPSPVPRTHEPPQPEQHTGHPSRATPPAEVDPHHRPHERPPAEPPTEQPTGQPTTTTPPTPTTATPTPTTPTTPTADAAAAAATGHQADEPEQDFEPSWLLPGLAGAGSLLAGAVLLAVRAHRRTQRRYRSPGYTIAPPPPEVRAVEKTTTVTGGPTADVVVQLDRILRHLASVADPRPTLQAIEIGRQTVTLYLAEPDHLPEPWRGSEARWNIDLDAPVAEEDQLPPYPLLASIGQGADGHLWLLDLEHLGVVSVTGDEERARGLARHLAAELALSPWAVVASIDVVDVAAELARLVPGRLTHHGADDTAFLTRIHADLTQAQQNGHGDPEPYRALIVAGAGDEQVRALVDLVQHQTSRSGLAVVAAGSTEPGDVVIDVTPDGRLRVPHLDLDLFAAGLTTDEAEATAAIVDLTRDTTVVPIPREEGATGWRALADQSGALTDVHTARRPAGEAGSESLLPDAVQRYEAVAATTADDIDKLAPVVSEQSRQAGEDADPGLDEDLAEWRDSESRLPKLTLLGPVTVAAKAGVAVREVAERKAYFTEMVAYLALHPSGVSSGQVRDAFGISASRARTDLGCIRTWFGTSPRTGLQHLPPANSSPAHADRGTNGYQLRDVLVDFDLFRRLRVRAQARGAEGIADLVTALELVTGEPFTALRDPGWSWLLDEERIHETAVFAVVDVAHLVAIDALSRGDLTRARFAAETGCMAAPHDEVCRLDLAKVAEAEGHTALADQILDQHVFNRTDDHLPPIDLPQRTADVVKNHGWGAPKRPAKD